MGVKQSSSMMFNIKGGQTYVHVPQTPITRALIHGSPLHLTSQVQFELSIGGCAAAADAVAIPIEARHITSLACAELPLSRHLPGIFGDFCMVNARCRVPGKSAFLVTPLRVGSHPK